MVIQNKRNFITFYHLNKEVERETRNLASIRLIHVCSCFSLSVFCFHGDLRISETQVAKRSKNFNATWHSNEEVIDEKSFTQIYG